MVVKNHFEDSWVIWSSAKDKSPGQTILLQVLLGDLKKKEILNFNEFYSNLKLPKAMTSSFFGYHPRNR